jgi:peptide/nickel transport system permease protein
MSAPGRGGTGLVRRTLRLPSARLAVVVLAVIAVLVVFGGALAPQDPLFQDTSAMLQGPSAHHLLGTDYLGRDVLSRLVAGTRLSVLSALEAVLVGLVLGAVPGVASVFFGRVFDFVSNRITDALMTLPTIVFAIAVVGVLGNGLVQAMMAIGVLLAPAFFRITRAAALQFGHAQYVEAAELFGASRAHIVRTHVWRKVLPTVAVTSASAMASALLTVASLAFLGLGVVPPAPTWGGVLAADLDYLAQAPWAPTAPMVLLMLTVGACNTLADAAAALARQRRGRARSEATTRTPRAAPMLARLEPSGTVPRPEPGAGG